MSYGSIFKEMFGINPVTLTIEEIEEKAIKVVKFKTYGGNIVPKRGNIFATKKFNINKLVDDSLKVLLVKN